LSASLANVDPANPRPATTTAAAVHRRRSYYVFIYPAMLVMGLVIVFPWFFTVFMSLNDWGVASPPVFSGVGNYLGLVHDDRFLSAVWRTFYYAILGVVFPVVLGTLSAVVFHQRFPLRSFLRGIFIMPMMATPVAIALIWAMIFHPQLGVLNYLLSLLHVPPSLWIYAPNTVIPSLALIETWEWTPLVMLIVVGGLAAIPTDPYESAIIDGANWFQIFRYVTLPLSLPFIMVAAMLRTIDALKAFDIIYTSTQGGPGTASETINIFLYLEAFAYYKVGYASAVVVVFFVIIVVCSLLMLYLRQKTIWT
jgi:multiple sugar transport system permease protein